MGLSIQKRLASRILKCSNKKVWLNPKNLEDIKEAITKADIRALINKGEIKKKVTKRKSKVRSRKRKEQRKKGRQKGSGSRKGKSRARLSKKKAWTNKIRAQRIFIKSLRDTSKITKKTYRSLYNKCNGGLFRSKRHIKLYINEHRLIKNEEKKK